MKTDEEIMGALLRPYTFPKSPARLGELAGLGVPEMYARVEAGLSPAPCRGCLFFYGRRCHNSNWGGPPHDPDRAPCGGGFWTHPKEWSP